jgi:DNA-binding transcriptional LysR family regulator
MTPRCLLIGFLIFLLTGCGAPSLGTPAPTPEAIKIIYPASLQPWADFMANCADDQPEVALYFIQQAGLNASINTNEIDLMLGQPPVDRQGLYDYQVGWEQVVVVVNKNNALVKLSNDLLKQILSGQTVNWENGSIQPIQVWALPESDPTRRIFEQALALDGPLANETKLAPDPRAVLKEIATQENAIGYLPHSYLIDKNSSDVNSVKIIQLDPSLEQSLHQPVIAITQGEPTELTRNLLTCLQNVNR